MRRNVEEKEREVEGMRRIMSDGSTQASKYEEEIKRIKEEKGKEIKKMEGKLK